MDKKFLIVDLFNSSNSNFPASLANNAEFKSIIEKPDFATCIHKILYEKSLIELSLKENNDEFVDRLSLYRNLYEEITLNKEISKGGVINFTIKNLTGAAITTAPRVAIWFTNYIPGMTVEHKNIKRSYLYGVDYSLSSTKTSTSFQVTVPDWATKLRSVKYDQQYSTLWIEDKRTADFFCKKVSLNRDNRHELLINRSVKPGTLLDVSLYNQGSTTINGNIVFDFIQEG